MEYNIEGKNTMEILETKTGITIVLKSSESKKPNNGDEFWYVAFNAVKGFFTWNGVWHDSDMGNALYLAGNCFSNENESNEIAEQFNQRLKIRNK